MTKQQYEKLVECRECLRQLINEYDPNQWYQAFDMEEATAVLEGLTTFMQRQGDIHNWWDYSHQGGTMSQADKECFTAEMERFFETAPTHDVNGKPIDWQAFCVPEGCNE